MIVKFEEFGNKVIQLAKINITAGTQALNKTANQCRKKVREKMAEVFDRPTPYTLNSIFVKYATDTDQEAIVKIKDSASSGISPTNYLGPEVFGGKRNAKRSEQAFRASGLLESNSQYIIGDKAPKDQYGNLSRGTIQQALADTKSFRDSQQNTNGKKKKKKKNRFFAAAGRDATGESKTIYMRSGSNTIPILIPTHAQTYKKRLDFEAIVEETYNQNVLKNFDEMLQKEWNNITS